MAAKSCRRRGRAAEVASTVAWTWRAKEEGSMRRRVQGRAARLRRFTRWVLVVGKTMSKFAFVYGGCSGHDGVRLKEGEGEGEGNEVRIGVVDDAAVVKRAKSASRNVSAM